MRQVGWVSVAGGAFIVLVCGTFFILSFQYEMGSLSRMRPGLFPAILGAVGFLVGAALIVNGVFRGAGEVPAESVPLRALVCTLAAIAGFAFLIRSTGLLPAVFVSTGLSALSDPRNNLLTTIGLALAAASLVSVIFVWALGLPLPFIEGVF